MLLKEVECQFTKVVRTRIVEETRRTIHGQTFDNIAQLTTMLKQIYSSPKKEKRRGKTKGARAKRSRTLRAREEKRRGETKRARAKKPRTPRAGEKKRRRRT